MNRHWIGVLVVLTASTAAQAGEAEDRAVKIVERLNGRVTRDDKQPGSPVIKVNLSLKEVADADLKGLAALKNLTHLDLFDTKVTDAGLKELAALTNLTHLNLFGTKVTDAGLKELAALKNLTHLALFRTKVTDAGLKELAPLKNLTYLNLQSTKITDAGLPDLAKITNLTELILPVGVTDAGLKELAPLKNLIHLDLAYRLPYKETTTTFLDPSARTVKTITDKTLAELRKINLLHALSEARAKDGKRPKSAEDVAALYLDDSQVTDAGLKELAPLKNLTTLYLHFAEVGDAGLKDLAQLDHLATLSLYGTKVTDAGLKELAQLKSLTTLNLNNTKVTDARLKDLAPLKTLNTLSLSYETITDKSLAELRKINLLHALVEAGTKDGKRPRHPEDVTSLNLNSTRVTDDGLKELASFKNLTDLFMTYRAEGITGKTLAELGKINLLYALHEAEAKDGKRPQHPEDVLKLHLQYTRVTDEGLKALAPFKNVTYLALTATHVTDAGLAELANLKNLTVLYLYGTKVTDEGVRKLQKALPKCQIDH